MMGYWGWGFPDKPIRKNGKMSDDLTTAYNLGYTCAKDMAMDEIERLQREAAIRIDALEREQEAHLRTIADYNRVAVENDKLKKELEFAIKGVEKYEAIIDSEKELAKDDLSKKLREANGYLFRDWKENAALMWQAAEEIEKLRKALKDIVADMNGTQFPQTNVRAISVGTLNAAAAAIRESGDD